MSGIFITLEGVEGCGKSTQIELLNAKLRDAGAKTLVTREPGGTEAGAAIRKILLDPATGKLDPLTELMLFSAARRELVQKVIRPALDEGRVVICDRFADSTTAYQGHARGMDPARVEGMAREVCGGVWPDRTIVLDIPVEEGLKRAIGRNDISANNESRFEEESLAFHKRVRQGFLKIAEAEPDRVKVIDASGTIEQVHRAALAAVRDIVPELATGN